MTLTPARSIRPEEDAFDEVVIAGAHEHCAGTAACFSPDDEVLTKLENRG
jgi:hypothetical protein